MCCARAIETAWSSGNAGEEQRDKQLLYMSGEGEYDSIENKVYLGLRVVDCIMKGTESRFGILREGNLSTIVRKLPKPTCGIRRPDEEQYHFIQSIHRLVLIRPCCS